MFLRRMSRDGAERLAMLTEAVKKLREEVAAASRQLDSLFDWQRVCHGCGRQLERTDPMQKVVCPGCGWVWE